MTANRSLRALALSALCLGLAAPLAIHADDDEHEGGHRGSRHGGPRVAPATDPLYVKECGGCHFAYQPGFLPAQSWDKLMGDLANHFGENAELPAEDTQRLRAYLLDNAASPTSGLYARKGRNGLGADPAPLRISATDYFLKEHRGLKPEMVTGNPKVGSISNCAACHTDANEGYFKGRAVDVPGYGRVDD